MEKVTISEAVIYIDETEIIHIKTFDKAFIGVNEATDILTIAKHFVLSEPKSILVDLRQHKKITTKARILFKKSNFPEKYKAKAIVVNTELISKIKNIFIRFNHQSRVKFFASEIEARWWLCSFN